jgi:hypothetical protein
MWDKATLSPNLTSLLPSLIAAVAMRFLRRDIVGVQLYDGRDDRI